MKKISIFKTLLLLSISSLLFSCGNEKLPIIQNAAEFELFNQFQKPVSLSKLEDKIKILSFIYVRCQQATMCPMTTRKFQELQVALGETMNSQTELLLVSFDPSHDSSIVLNSYGELYGADFGNWHFLTGDIKEIEKVCQEYQIIVEKEKNESFRHSTLTFLIDRANHVRKIKVGNDWEPGEMKQLIASLLKEKNSYLPANAVASGKQQGSVN